MAIRDTVRRKLTYSDYILFPEDGNRHEVLDGEHYVTPAPNLWHQGVSSNLHTILGPFVREHRLGRVFAAPVDVLLSDNDVAQPDLVFVSNERAGALQDPRYIQGAPDLAIEILSPSSRRSDEIVKRHRYEQLGVLEYWIVDPQQRTVRVFRRAGELFAAPEEFSASDGDVLITPLLPGLEISVGSIFE
jgi:Uma2 family endonuclease